MQCSTQLPLDRHCDALFTARYISAKQCIYFVWCSVGEPAEPKALSCFAPQMLGFNVSIVPRSVCKEGILNPSPFKMVCNRPMRIRISDADTFRNMTWLEKLLGIKTATNPFALATCHRIPQMLTFAHAQWQYKANENAVCNTCGAFLDFCHLCEMHMWLSTNYTCLALLFGCLEFCVGVNQAHHV